MRFAGPLFALLFASGVHALPYVDPTAIEADAPEMLQPSAVYSFCAARTFAIALEPVQPRHAEIEGEELKHPLDEHGGRRTIECKLGKDLIAATLRISPPGGNGMCGAVHFVGLELQVNDQLLLGTKFAEYCSPWGITSVTLIKYDAGYPLATVRMCGYWREDVAVANSGIKVYKRSFECSDFAASELLENKLHISDPRTIYQLK